MLLQLLALGFLVQIEAEISKQNSYADVSPFIVKGDQAAHNQFPWHADLEINKINNLTIKRGRRWSYCGGSLIRNNIVLTAAHCLREAKRIKVRLGVITDSRELFKTHAKRYVQHPNYVSGSYRDDIGIIELLKSPPISESITMVALPLETIAQEIAPGLIGTVCGFGRTDPARKDSSSKVLLWLKVRIVSNEQCKQSHKSPITNDMMCADGINLEQNICYGDSGGGLVVKLKEEHYLVGIASFAKKTCIGAPAVYTRVSSFVDWIFETIASLPTYETL